MKCSSVSLLLISATLLTSQSAQADVKDIISANSQIGAQFVTTNVDYTETSQEGIKADTEEGFVPGFGISLSAMKNVLFGNDYIAFQFSKLNGATDYIGGANTPNILSAQPSKYGSVTQSNGAQLIDFNGRIGKGFELNNSIMFTPYFEIGHHNWNRQIRSKSPVVTTAPFSLGSKEEYNNYYFGFGTMGQFTPINKLVITANAMVGSTFLPTMSSSGTSPVAAGIGAGSATTYNLGSSIIYKFGLSFDYAFYQNFHVNAGAEYSAFDYGKSSVSNTTPASYEPYSQTNYTTVKAGFGYSF